MATTVFDEEDILDEETYKLFINFPPEVQEAVEQVLPSSDPLDRPDFNVVDYINTLFPTEQSLSNIDDTLSTIKGKIHGIDEEIRSVVRGQTHVGKDGQTALLEAQQAIQELFIQVREIKGKADESEAKVREITRDIRTLDTAKRNLTAGINTLHHLQMLVGGVQDLQNLCKKRQYGDVARSLQLVMEVLDHFSAYMQIPQIFQLSEQVKQIRSDLADQITSDFKDTFSPERAKSALPTEQLSQACLVVSELDPKVKRDLLGWYVGLQLEEYKQLFSDNQPEAWLDKIDRRYAWFKRHTMDFEKKFGAMFPEDWEISERIAVEFCSITRTELSRLMSRRVNEIDVKLLLGAIETTTKFESLLARRYTGVTVTVDFSGDVTKGKSTNPFEEGGSGNPFAEDMVAEEPDKPKQSPFIGMISRSFEAHLNIYVDSQDRNLSDLIERFCNDMRSGNFGEGGSVLPSCGDLFMFYKRCLMQCTKLCDPASRPGPLLSLTHVFQKHLREYSSRVLFSSLPKQSNVVSVTNLAKDLSTSGIIHNFQSFLKEGEASRFTVIELQKICSILSTASYCLDTTQQLESKLKEKVTPGLSNQVSLAQEQNAFHGVISNCLQLLVQDLESACEPALIAMSKVSWQSVISVGDQSSFVTAITSHLKQTVPAIRDALKDSLPYFIQFCHQFANGFMSKFCQQLFKCKPVSTVGAEQLLLDTHMLKTTLMDLPNVGTQLAKKPPANYTKVVVKGMGRAEMLLKIVMSQHDPPKPFVDRFIHLLPESDVTEFQKVLDMKGVRRSEQNSMVELFRNSCGGAVSDSSTTSSVLPESSRIRKLEKMITKHL